MQLTFLGTGGAQQVPVFGCQCEICQRARQQPQYRRAPCSAMIRSGEETTLLDAGSDLYQRFGAGDIRRILLTHYHMDHVQGLFPLRWGVGAPIPVYGPPDELGCDDLFKHPGILQFQSPLTAFKTVSFGALSVTPLPLIHSKITLGYLLQDQQTTMAWLCDTIDIPPETDVFLRRQTLDHLILDCSYPPCDAPQNHNDLQLALKLHHQLKPRQSWLTHLSHQVDSWLQHHPLPAGVAAAYDGLVLGG